MQPQNYDTDSFDYNDLSIDKIMEEAELQSGNTNQKQLDVCLN